MQFYPETGSFLSVRDIDLASHFIFDDHFGHIEANSMTAAFSGEVYIKNVIDRLKAHPTRIVAHTDL